MSITDLPELPPGEDYDRLLTEIAHRVSGFVYPGDRAEAVVSTIRHLRADPDLARQLLNTSPDAQRLTGHLLVTPPPAAAIDPPPPEAASAVFDLARKLRDPDFRRHLTGTIGYTPETPIIVAQPNDAITVIFDQFDPDSRQHLLAVPDPQELHGWRFAWVQSVVYGNPPSTTPRKKDFDAHAG